MPQATDRFSAQRGHRFIVPDGEDQGTLVRSAAERSCLRIADLNRDGVRLFAINLPPVD